MSNKIRGRYRAQSSRYPHGSAAGPPSPSRTRLPPASRPATPRYEYAVRTGYCDFGGLLIGDSYCAWDRLGRVEGIKDADPKRAATFHFFDRRTGKSRGRGRLPINNPDGASAERRLAEEHNRDHWRWLGAGQPWAEGDRLYIGAYDFLWCIGDPAKAFVPPEAALKRTR